MSADSRFKLAVIVAMSVSSCASMATAQQSAPPPEEGKRHALLIGCTAYPELEEKYQLQGPANDVALTTTLLKEKFKFTKGEIVTLLHDREESMRPTHDNIFREFAKLIDSVGSGDTVFIMIGGHGSQQVNDNPDDPNDIELDGLDEVFLPEDVTEWAYKKPVIKAIRDDQIRPWLDAIRAKGASVFFVADTCHSGTIDRGPADEYVRDRFVEPKLINGPLPKVPKIHPEEQDLVDSGAEDEPDAAASGTRGGLIALYAVTEDKKEKEQPMPPEKRKDGPRYGRLTYALNWVLTQSVSKKPMTYRELAQAIRWQYANWEWQDVGFLLGTPDELKREVMGRQTWAGRSDVILSRDDLKALSLNVGVLHGATVGSIYSVFPPIGAAGDGQALGYVIVTEATPTTARRRGMRRRGAARGDGRCAAVAGAL